MDGATQRSDIQPPEEGAVLAVIQFANREQYDLFQGALWLLVTADRINYNYLPHAALMAIRESVENDGERAAILLPAIVDDEEPEPKPPGSIGMS